MFTKTLRIATRKSPLALWQANHIREQLLQYWPALQIELIPLVTSGDKFLKDKLLAIGGKGLFVKELEEALLNGQADVAVHSMKDVPVFQPDGLELNVICIRDNPFDAFLSIKYNKLNELPEGAIIGTASLRRQSQLLALRPDLNILPLRGNIQTRMQKLQTEEYDAIILACAGLERMGLQQMIKQVLSPEIMLPACGQGALGIECRTQDDAVKTLIAPLHNEQTALCVRSERQLNARLGGNCHVPLAVFSQLLSPHKFLLRARVATVDGKTILNNHQVGRPNQALELAHLCAEDLLMKGALDLLS